MLDISNKQEVLRRDRHRRVDAAKRYAAANNSDPFAYARAMTHIGNGIAGPNTRHDPVEYDAEQSSETRKLPDGTEYQATVYRNVVRA